MMTLMRTIVDLHDEQFRALGRLCAEQKISRTEAVRRAVSQLLKSAAANRKDAGFGIWKHKKTDSRKLVDRLRAVWIEK